VLKSSNSNNLNREDRSTMGYFDDLDRTSKKIEKNLKNKNKNIFIDVFFYLWIDGYLNFMQFHYRLIVHQRPSNFHIICNGSNLTVFDGLSNDNEID
jgi:hypothetical protein